MPQGTHTHTNPLHYPAERAPPAQLHTRRPYRRIYGSRYAPPIRGRCRTSRTIRMIGGSLRRHMHHGEHTTCMPSCLRAPAPPCGRIASPVERGTAAVSAHTGARGAPYRDLSFSLVGPRTTYKTSTAAKTACARHCTPSIGRCARRRSRRIACTATAAPAPRETMLSRWYGSCAGC